MQQWPAKHLSQPCEQFEQHSAWPLCEKYVIHKPPPFPQLQKTSVAVSWMVMCTHGVVEIQAKHMQHYICLKTILYLPDISKWSLMENQDAFLCGAGGHCDS